MKTLATRSRCIGLILVALLMLVACTKPIPADKQSYIGTWESATMSLVVSREGRVIYKHEPTPSTRKSIEAPIKAFEGNDMVVGVGPLTTRFVVSLPPHQADGAWKMTVDGEALTRR
ncbi:hypothetical protein [Stenotrophomonas sp. Iso1]|uniref:hypothetical protein n=1 Tax=Stenotrophomonas sp. Iso1 TaxID=2977283 RepID=UPI0022B7A98F|nr:hypothetical protein [Stenotrophomonas sp. Iso1]